MSMIHINELKPGMVLAGDVKDLNGGLMLSKGNTVEPKHLRIFQLWGVTDINVCKYDDRSEKPKPDFDQGQIETVTKLTQRIFRHADIGHPAAKEIFRLSVLSIAKNNFLQ